MGGETFEEIVGKILSILGSSLRIYSHTDSDNMYENLEEHHAVMRLRV